MIYLCTFEKKHIPLTYKGWKRPDLDVRYPQMCQTLFQWPDSFGENLCQNIQAMDNTTMHQILMSNLYNYARENLALVNIYIKVKMIAKF